METIHMGLKSHLIMFLVLVLICNTFVMLPVEGFHASSTPEAQSPSSPSPWLSSPTFSSISAPPASSPSYDEMSQALHVIEKSVVLIKDQADGFVKNVITKRINDPTTDVASLPCLKQCQENFESADHDVSGVLEALAAGDLATVSVDLGAMATNIDTCEDCMVEMVGGDPEINKFEQWVRGVTSDCLAHLADLGNNH